MGKQVVNIGTTDNDGTGDSLRVGGDKINDNFTELYDLPTTITGTCTTARTTAAKTVTIANYTLRAKDTLAITFTDGFSVNNATLNVNGGGAINMRVGAVNVTTALVSVAAATSFTVNLYYDGTYFYFPGSQLNTDTNTTYTEISEAEITAGTASTARSISGRRSEFIVTKARTGLQETLVSGTNIKTVNSTSLLGSGDISISGSVDINGTTEKTTPDDADVALIEDSAASWAKKKLSWTNIKATLKTYFDTLYATIAQTKEVFGINDQTGTTYTLVLTDAGKLVRCNNAASITLTVPQNSSVAFPVNTVITVEQKGAGVITITADTNVTCNAFGGLLSAGQYAGLSLIKVDTNVWTVFGGVSA